MFKNVAAPLLLASLTRSLLMTIADKELKMVLEKRGYHFATETDTETVAVLCKYIWDSQPTKRLTFTTLIKAVIKELVRLCAALLVSKVLSLITSHVW